MPAYCPPPHCSAERQVLKNRDQVHINCSRIVEPKLRHATYRIETERTPNGSADINKTQQIEMNKINNTADRSSAIDFSNSHDNANDSEMTSVNDQNDRRFPKDDDDLLPNQTVIATEV